MAKIKELEQEEQTPIDVQTPSLENPMQEESETPVEEEMVGGTPNRDSFMNNIREKYPDYENDEDVYAHANKSYGNLKQGKADADMALESLSDAIENEPELAEFIRMVIKYPNDFSIALRSLPKDVLEMAIDNYDEPIDDEEETKSLQSYRTQKQSNKDWESKFDENLNVSKERLQAVATKKGVDPSVISQAIEETLMEVFDGNISEELMETILKGREFDKKVEEVAEESREQGVLEGKNSKIEETKLKKKTDTDGLVTPPNVGRIRESKDDRVPEILNFKPRKEFGQ